MDDDYADDETARLTLELVRRLAAGRLGARVRAGDEPGLSSGTEPTLAYCPPELRYRKAPS